MHLTVWSFSKTCLIPQVSAVQVLKLCIYFKAMHWCHSFMSSVDQSSSENEPNWWWIHFLSLAIISNFEQRKLAYQQHPWKTWMLTDIEVELLFNQSVLLYNRCAEFWKNITLFFTSCLAKWLDKDNMLATSLSIYVLVCNRPNKKNVHVLFIYARCLCQQLSFKKYLMGKG